MGLIHNLPSQHLHRNILITATISARCRWPRERRIQQQNDRLSPCHKYDQWLFFPSKGQKKTVISISILILIYIEMNPDANERNGMYLKQVPRLHRSIHPEEYQKPSSMSIKCSATFQSKEGGEKQGKTFEHNTVLTRELMSCLGTPRFDKQKWILKHRLNLAPLLTLLPLLLTTKVKSFI